jgi:hypothetical protein
MSNKKIVRKGSTQGYVASNNGNVILSQEVKKPTPKTGTFYGGFKMP